MCTDPFLCQETAIVLAFHRCVAPQPHCGLDILQCVPVHPAKLFRSVRQEERLKVIAHEGLPLYCGLTNESGVI